MALSADKVSEIQPGNLTEYRLAGAVRIFKGALVNLNTAGNAKPASDGSGEVCVGIADESVDNSTGGAGAKTIRVRSGIRVRMKAASIAQTMVGALMYVEDDETIDDAAGPTNDVIVGVLTKYISATDGVVYIPEGGGTMATR